MRANEKEDMILRDRSTNALVLSLFAAIAVSALVPLPASAANVSFTLYGNATDGWGLSNASIADPGPSLQVDEGDNVTITVVLNDTEPHTWFIDYNNNSLADTGEPISPIANTGNPVRTFSFPADRTGTFTYRCSFHPGTMKGTIVIAATDGTPPAPADNTLLIVGGAIVAVIIVAAAAMMMRKRGPKTPQPPTQP
ncbi:MAG: cupredoxin domain-containing protein [Methanobacteriota archaeon]